MKNKHEKIISEIIDISKKYQFQYLDEENENNELKLEYVGDDVIYKDEDDFKDKFEFDIFVKKQMKIIEEQFEKAIKEIKKSISINGYEYDYYDYPCVYVYYNI